MAVTVHNMLGQEVAILVDGMKGTGMHTILWNGKNRSGEEVGSGIYLCRLRSGDTVEKRRMMLLR